MCKNKPRNPTFEVRPCEHPKRCNVRIIIIIHACGEALRKLFDSVTEHLGEWTEALA